MSQFKNRVFAITGAASGMGLATATKLYELEAKLSVVDIDEAQLNAVMTTLASTAPERPKDDILTTVVDVRSTAQVDAWIEGTIKHFGFLHGAVNCAGTIGAGVAKYSIEELPDEIWKTVLDINLSGLFYCLRAELKAMTRGGSVVNYSSIAGVKGNALNASYSASKHGVVGLTKTAAQEVGWKGIRVNCVVP
jgi:NAD(P)-dependent dehydrogenase (short-subunit alcohol dehydrogenase family)